MARRAPGSNQYRTRWRPAPVSARDPLLDQAAAAPEQTSMCLCGEVWNSSCSTLVGPPDYSHDAHGVHEPLYALMLPTAHNSGANPLALRALASHDRWPIRRALAQNTACPPDILLQLAQDPHEQVREAASRNRSMPSEYRALLKVTQ
jgi:hypothetical protein